MNYRKYQGVILRKQNYKEADQIATIYTKEAGKVRVLAKGIRLKKSKLAGSFQDLSLISFEASGRHSLPVLISSKIIKNFVRSKQDISKTAAAFYAVELATKITADEQPNTHLFELLVRFLTGLETVSSEEEILFPYIDRFSLKLLEVSGYSIRHAKSGLKLDAKTEQLLHMLSEDEYMDRQELVSDKRTVKKLHKLINDFAEYILERHINSQKFLTSI
jgi:DNA repair protein RecO